LLIYIKLRVIGLVGIIHKEVTESQFYIDCKGMWYRLAECWGNSQRNLSLNTFTFEKRIKFEIGL
jgi:hypothetical protein